MTLCPYKWFLYIASAWALVYIMVEAWMNFGTPNALGAKPTDAQRDYADDDDDDDSDDECNNTPSNKPVALPSGHPSITHRPGARCPFGFSSSR